MALLGIKLTEEHKRKIGLANAISHKGKILSENHKQNIGTSHKGLKYKKWSEESRKRLSMSKKGKPSPKKGCKLSIEQIEKMRQFKLKNPVRYWLGKKRPEVKTFIGFGMKKGHIPWNKGKKVLATTGEKNSNWKGGITPIHSKIRGSVEYKLWRDSVFKRDNYTCVWCGYDKGHIIEADHIKPFSLYPELRFAIDNGRTLCRECHKKIGWSLFRENNPKKIIK